MAFADNITPTGGIDGSNAIFTLSAGAPSPAASLQLYYNGLVQRPAGEDFTLVGDTITYTTASKPKLGGKHVAFYRY